MRDLINQYHDVYKEKVNLYKDTVNVTEYLYD